MIHMSVWRRRLELNNCETADNSLTDEHGRTGVAHRPLLYSDLLRSGKHYSELEPRNSRSLSDIRCPTASYRIDAKIIFIVINNLTDRPWAWASGIIIITIIVGPNRYCYFYAVPFLS